MDRRSFLTASAGLAGALVAAPSGAATSASTIAAATPASAALEVMRDNPLVNRPHAIRVMAEAGVDGLICARDQNVYHLTNFWPVMQRMGTYESSVALLSANPDVPPALTMGEFTHFYIYQPWGLRFPTETYVYTSPADMDAYAALGEARLRGDMPPAAASRPVGMVDEGLATAWERARFDGTEAAKAAHGVAPGIEWSIVKAARDLGLDRGRIAVDSPMVAKALTLAGLNIEIVEADNILRRIRYAHSPTEIAIHRIAAQNNAEAGLATARAIQPGMSYRDIRALFYAEAARRGNTGVFMVVDRVASELHDGEVVAGQALMIDCVSQFMGYHGDYARTVFVGEPNPMMTRAVQAMQAGWHTIRENLKPGLTFSAIRQMGQAAQARAGLPEFTIGFGPHAVGLNHSDSPYGDGPVRRFIDNELIEGVVVSVDCPVVNDGIGGSCHLEDLMLITKDGSEPIHATGDELIVV